YASACLLRPRLPPRPPPLFSYTTRRPPRSPLFPYTTLFRSATITPMFTTGAGTFLGGEYRQRFGSGKLTSDGSITFGSKAATARSEEHTSELQSLTNLVCRLLLEKKKQTMTTHHHPTERTPP